MSDWTLKPEQVLAENAERVKDFMRQLTRQNRYLNALYDMSLTVVNHLDVQELLQVSVEQAVSLVGAKHGYLYLVDEDSQVAVVNVACGEYTITTHADASQVYLEIEDSGPGFREEVLEKIFEPFFTTKESSEGMGLGLALVQSITVSHGGQITAHNTGNGASFIVELPIYRAEP